MISAEEFRSDSPAIKISGKVIDDKDTNVSVQTVPCAKCNRNFTLERIQTHEQVCNKTKERKVYDIVQMRVKGTESEKLVKSGKFLFILKNIYFLLRASLICAILKWIKSDFHD